MKGTSCCSLLRKSCEKHRSLFQARLFENWSTGFLGPFFFDFFLITVQPKVVFHKRVLPSIRALLDPLQIYIPKLFSNWWVQRGSTKPRLQVQNLQRREGSGWRNSPWQKLERPRPLQGTYLVVRLPGHKEPCPWAGCSFIFESKGYLAHKKRLNPRGLP